MPHTAFYSQLDKIILAGLIGTGAAVGMRMGTTGVTEELVKIRETLTIAVTRLEGHEQRITNMERLYMTPHPDAR